MATVKQSAKMAHARRLLAKRAELAKHQEAVQKSRIKMATVRAELAQLRGQAK